MEKEQNLSDKENLSEDEKNNFNKSIDSVKELFNAAIKIDSKLGF